MKKYVGGRIRAARRDAGLTQDQLAGMIDKSVETISNLERGHTAPSLDTLGRLARALNQPTEWFLKGNGAYAGNGVTTALRAEIEVTVAKMTEAQLRQVVDILRIVKGGDPDA